ncbi:hypothetical protein XAP6164_4370005 [Xanthomonas phaseoli pv. phaseoli]|nr:hypothetical protein XAP6164_4370005 [Xanthomonas phaseoli pv. phaseoli]
MPYLRGLTTIGPLRCGVARSISDRWRFVNGEILTAVKELRDVKRTPPLRGF